MDRSDMVSKVAWGLALAVAGSCGLAWAGTTEVVTVALTASIEPEPGSSNPSISVDGRYVAFTSFGANLVAGEQQCRYCRPAVGDDDAGVGGQFGKPRERRD
jgi:hypothetical protein